MRCSTRRRRSGIALVCPEGHRRRRHRRPRGHRHRHRRLHHLREVAEQLAEAILLDCDVDVSNPRTAVIGSFVLYFSIGSDVLPTGMLYRGAASLERGVIR